jgi:hypothetical protein
MYYRDIRTGVLLLRANDLRLGAKSAQLRKPFTSYSDRPRGSMDLAKRFVAVAQTKDIHLIKSGRSGRDIFPHAERESRDAS